MSDSDNSDFEMNNNDVDDAIVHTLSSGSKISDELVNLVSKKTGVTERTCYRHLEKLVRINVIERLIGNNSGSRPVYNYALKTSKVPEKGSMDALLNATPEIFVEEVVPSRRYLEVAAWLKREPDDWPQLEAVRKARITLEASFYLVPTIEASCEDPDRYSFVWTDEPCYGQRLGEFVQSRSFKLKNVYRAIVEDSTASLSGSDETLFVGAFESNVVAEQVVHHGDMEMQIKYEHKPMELKIEEEPFSVCIAVSKEVESGLRVVYVEGKSGKIDKSWVKGISKQLSSRSQAISSYRDLKADTKRDVLLNLRNSLEKHTLKVPNRYVKLIEELLDHSYKNPSSGYVYALALAVDLATQKRRESSWIRKK